MSAKHGLSFIFERLGNITGTTHFFSCSLSPLREKKKSDSPPTSQCVDVAEEPAWLIVPANFMVVVHVIRSYQVHAMPHFDILERLMVKRLNFSRGIALRLVARSTDVAFMLFLGVTFPFFGNLLDFFGGFGFAPTSYFCSSITWLIIKKPGKFNINWGSCNNRLTRELGLVDENVTVPCEHPLASTTVLLELMQRDVAFDYFSGELPELIDLDDRDRCYDLRWAGWMGTR
ncbi:Aa_trans domain-containing protein [Psidium guajava]|nr:Aa_trans domain-containing protein [Psidium guajava]